MSTTDFKPGWLDWPQTQALIAAFAAGGADIRFVGGAVRDAVLGRPVQDVDAATPLLPQAVMETLRQAHIQAIPTGIEHGTVTAVISEKHFEITTLRKDTACDGRHADVTFTDDWQEDAARRDFTLNALYMSPAGKLFDYFGGLDDARAGRVRFIGDPAQRIKEDYLRILRFFRFYAWYGKGEADLDAVAACALEVNQVNGLSGERIQQELLKLLSAPAACASAAFRALDIMHRIHLLPHVLCFEVSSCNLFPVIGQVEQTAGLSLPAYIKLAGFLLRADAGSKTTFPILVDRLKLSYAMIDALRTVVGCQPALSSDLPLSMQKKLLRKLGKNRFQWAVAIKWASADEQVVSGHPYHHMLSLAEQWQPPPFPISGSDLIELGIKPGKGMGELLNRLEETWETSDYALSREELLEKVK